MGSEIEQAVRAYVDERTAENLTKLERALIEGTLIVPVRHGAKDLGEGRFDIPAICFRRPDGAGVLPAFTSVENLFAWKSEGSKYVELAGRKLLQMAQGMVGIDEIVVNPNGVPRGAIPRSEFERLLAIQIALARVANEGTQSIVLNVRFPPIADTRLNLAAPGRNVS